MTNFARQWCLLSFTFHTKTQKILTQFISHVNTIPNQTQIASKLVGYLLKSAYLSNLYSL